MDRHDEKKSDDILGLGGSTVPKMPGDPSASDDPEAVRRRRERAMSSDADSGTSATTDDTHGATGIDMGAGGQGTDVSGK